MSLDQVLDVIFSCNLCTFGLSLYLWLLSEIYQLLTTGENLYVGDSVRRSHNGQDERHGKSYTRDAQNDAISRKARYEVEFN